MANKDELIISKSNPLLNMKNDFDLYQQRMINLYLAKINPLDEESRHVSVTLAQFVRLIGIKEVSARKMRALAERALGLRVDLYEVETDEAGKKHTTMQMDLINVWERFKVDVNKDGEWYVELLASTSIMPYMFQIQDLGYGRVAFLCAMRLRSTRAEKLYEQCVRFKDKGVFTITLEHLRQRIGISPDTDAYKSYNRLKNSVLKRCIQDINNKTDIAVSIVKENRLQLRGKPVKSVTFSVKPNENLKIDDADRELENLYKEEELKRIVDVDGMKSFEVESDKQITMDQYVLQQEYGLSEINAKTILYDKDKLGLSDDRIREVIEYAIKHTNSADGNPIKLIRYLFRNGSTPLEDKSINNTQNDKNPFNRFEQNQYDFDELEKVLLNNGDAGDEGEGTPAPVKEAHIKVEHLPPYYIVMGDPRAADRLAAYATLGISGDDIKILTPEEHAKLSGQE